MELAQRGDLDSSDQRLAQVLNKARVWQSLQDRPVNEQQRLVINRMLDGFERFLSTSKYAKLAKCSADTALRDIRLLLEHGVLVQNSGRGRSTSYRLQKSEDIST